MKTEEMLDSLISANQEYQTYLRRDDGIAWTQEKENAAAQKFFGIREKIENMLVRVHDTLNPDNAANVKMRVCWMPQVGAGIPAFHIPVQSPEDAVKVMTVLSAYDQFQYQHGIKPDYCNNGYVEMYDEDSHEWVGWEDDGDAGYYDDVDEYVEYESPAKEQIEQFQKEVLGQVKF